MFNTFDVTVHGSRFTVHGSRFTVHGSWFMVHGSWFMVHGYELYYNLGVLVPLWLNYYLFTSSSQVKK
jgi:hypothetical protein